MEPSEYANLSKQRRASVNGRKQGDTVDSAQASNTPKTHRRSFHAPIDVDCMSSDHSSQQSDSESESDNDSSSQDDEGSQNSDDGISANDNSECSSYQG
jgi:hypothetical protein